MTSFDSNSRRRRGFLPRTLGGRLAAAVLLIAGVFFLGLYWDDVFPKREPAPWPVAQAPGPGESVRIPLTEKPSSAAKAPPTPSTTPPAKAAAVAPAPAPVLKSAGRSRAPVRRVSSPAATGPCEPTNTQRPWSWRKAGGDPYARSQSEAFSDAKLDRMLVCMKVRQDHRAEIKAKLRSMNPMTVRLTKGQILNYMMFGHGVLADVNVQIPGGQLALLYELDVDGVHYVFYLPLECWNWARALVQSAPPPPSPCPHYRQQVKKGDLVVLAVTGPHGLPGGACKPRIRVAGTGVFVSPDTLPICLRSYGLDCDLSAAARMAGGAIQHQVAYRAEADGVTTLEVDPIIATSGSGYAIVTCLVRKGESSCGVITKPKHYRFDQRRKAKVATVYEPENLPERLLRSHWDQYWRKSTHGCPVRPD